MFKWNTTGTWWNQLNNHLKINKWKYIVGSLGIFLFFFLPFLTMSIRDKTVSEDW